MYSNPAGRHFRSTSRLEHEELIAEVKEFLKKAKTLRGGTARLHEAFLQGRLGELLFHSSQAMEAVEPFESALNLCVETYDIEGQSAYLNNLFEVHRCLDDGLAIPTAERLLDLQRRSGKPTEELQKRIERLRRGEPLCRIVCVPDGRELELDEITNVGEGRYQFQFRRNRLSLQQAITLTRQGNELASSGELSETLEKYRDASESTRMTRTPCTKAACASWNWELTPRHGKHLKKSSGLRQVGFAAGRIVGWL